MNAIDCCGNRYDTLMDEEDQISPKLHAIFMTLAVSSRSKFIDFAPWQCTVVSSYVNTLLSSVTLDVTSVSSRVTSQHAF